MSKFLVIPNGGGAARYSGCPTFTGTYMKPGMLEFREVSSPTPIDWEVGDYIGYQSGSSVIPVYSRTGLRYSLYSTPQVKKQARSTKYGGAFVYKNVQLFDDSKQLEICPFRDLVAGDNRIHFSTQPSISTFEGVDGIARRIQACLDDMYPNTWVVRLATTEMGASQDLVDLMAEAREFTVSGVSLLGALDKVYEVWPEVGWTFSYDSATGKNILTIGGGGLNSTSSFIYGKGNGLKSITRTAANAEELANRLFVYGSSRNMLPRWYNSQNIKDAQSVDIQNLMIPVSEWGLTNVEGTDLPDASKAYVEDAASIARLGLRPKTYYFDGTGDLPEIYPTLREATIKAVRDALGSSSEKYYPSAEVYTNPSQRVDLLLSATAPIDNGLSGDASGKASVDSEYTGINESGNTPFPAGYSARPVFLYSGTYTPSRSGDFGISLELNIIGHVDLAGIRSVNVYAGISEQGEGGTVILSEARSIVAEPGAASVALNSLSFNVSKVPIMSGVSYDVSFIISVEAERSELDKTCHVEMVGGYSISISNYRTKTFSVSIRQIGFDINEQSALGEGKTIAMRSGKCAGRTFVIKSAQYNSTTDSWDLECWRSEDESLSQWFPNTDYPVRGLENAGQQNEYPGDEFVLLDIAMPDIYVRMAEDRLYQAAQDLLLDTAVERWQYTPDIDAKFMVENERVIVAGQNMSLQDADIIGPSPVNILVDSLTINEGEAAIPTYKVTLRDRKRKTWTESESASSMSSKPVSNASQEVVSQMQSAVGESFFMLDESGNVTLKEPYQNLWVPGFLAAGGIGNDNGGGGGGLITSVKGVADLGTPIVTESLTETFSAKAIESIYEAVQERATALSLTSGGSYLLDSDGKPLKDSNGNYLVAGGDSSKVLNLLNEAGEVISSVELPIPTIDSPFVTIGEATINLGGSASLTDIGVPGWAQDEELAFASLPSLYIGRTPVKSTNTSNDTLVGIDGFTNAAADDVPDDTSMVVWEPNGGGTGIGAWHFKGNIYADGWIASGGIGAGGGGGAIFLNQSIEDVSVDTETLATGHILQWDGANGVWKNTTLSVTANPATQNALGGIMVGSVLSNTPLINQITDTAGKYYYVQCDSTGLAFVNIPWTSGSGGSTVEIDNLLSSGTRVATITIDGVDYNILAPTGGTPGSGETDPVFSASAAYGITTSDIAAWNAKVDASALADYALKTGAGTYNFLVNTLKFSIGTLAADNYGSTGSEKPRPKFTYSYVDMSSVSQPTVTETKFLAYIDEIPTTLKNPHALTFGSYTYDGSAARTLTAASIGAVTLAGAETITGAKTMTSTLTVGANIVPSTDIGSSLGNSSHRFANASVQTIEATTLNLINSTTKNVSGMLTAAAGYLIIRAGTNVGSSYKQLTLHETYGFYPETSGVNLGYNGANYRWANIYGVNADLTGDLKIASTSHIDIGPLRIEYDSVNGALHITTNVNNGTIPTLGIYADGFMASGGIQQSS